MQSQPNADQSLNDIPAATVHRWMMKAALLGLFVGVAAGIAALAN
jgi:hypothetical protein